jgi:hypothetical protein
MMRTTKIILFSIIIMSLYAISIYQSIFYTYPLGIRDLEVNENSNPEESRHLRSLFKKRGCEPEVCGCAMRLMYRSSSRAERVLLAYNSDYLNVLLMKLLMHFLFGMVSEIWA